MISFLRHSVERSSRNVTGCSPSVGICGVVEDRASESGRSGALALIGPPPARGPGPSGTASDLGPVVPRRPWLGPRAIRAPDRPGPVRPDRAEHRDRGHELLPAGHDHRWAELAEPRHRGGHGRPPDGHALVGLDGIEALGERVDLVGDDHDVGVLEEAGYLVVGTGAEEVDVGTASSRRGPRRGRLFGPDQHDLHVGPRRGQLDDQAARRAARCASVPT